MSWVSYLFPLLLHTTHTRTGEIIRVSELYGQKKLTINGYPQSNQQFRSMWKRLVTSLDLNTTGTVLILGLGGGDLVNLFARAYPRWMVTVVEIEPEVVRVANEYFGVTPHKKLRITLDDARTFIQRVTNTYDLIIVDLYDGDDIPTWVATPRFIKQVMQRLSLKGRVIFNYASFSFTVDRYTHFDRLLHVATRAHWSHRYWGHTFYVAT